MIGSDALTEEAERQDIVGQIDVLAQKTNGDDNDERVHQNSLIPTEIARQIMAHLAKI
jgi:hypothetical protein